MLPQKKNKIQGVAGAFWSGFGICELKSVRVHLAPEVRQSKLFTQASVIIGILRIFAVEARLALRPPTAY